MIFTAILAMFSGCSILIARINGGVQMCCTNWPILVQTIYLGVYRLNWPGKACSEEGEKFECGRRLSQGVGRSRHESDRARRDAEWLQRG